MEIAVKTRQDRIVVAIGLPMVTVRPNSTLSVLENC